MHPILRNILAVVAGIIAGSIVNMSLIMSSGFIIPYPEGFIEGDMESLAAFLPHFEIKHFIMPLLAHALGTLVGAFLAAKIAATHKLKFAFAIGAVFLYGGISMATSLPSPLWYDIIDIGFAYIPMAFLGWKLSKTNKPL